MDIILIVFALAYAAIFVLYLKDSFSAKKPSRIFPLVASLITMLVVSLLTGEVYGEISFAISLTFAVLFSILPSYYAGKTTRLIIFLLAILLGFVYTTYVYGSILYPFMQAFAIGTTFGLLYKKGPSIARHTRTRSGKKLEIRRDIIHIVLGIIVLSLFLLLPFYYAVYVSMLLILTGYVYNSIVGGNPEGAVYRFLSSFERPEALYGEGSLYLAMGMAIILGFIHDTHFVIIGIAALLFADPIATIVGLGLHGRKLPYNKKKSIYGTIAFFLAVSLMGYPFVGAYSLIFGATLALVESANSAFDDNLRIAVFMVVVYAVFLLLTNRFPFF